MRDYFFTFKDEESRNVVFDSFYELFKGHKEFETGKIIFCRTVEDGINKVYLSISDEVTGSFGIINMNAMGEKLKLQFFATSEACNDFDVVLPSDCMFGSSWEEEKKK